jgi:hypothetical protein
MAEYGPKFWAQERREAAVRELEERFQVTLSEEAIFQAATLFLSLLESDSFIDRDEVKQAVDKQLALSSATLKRKRQAS